MVQIVNAENYSDVDWNTYPEFMYFNYTISNSSFNWSDNFSGELDYVSANNTLKIEYSLEGIEQSIKGLYCWSKNATLQDGFGKDMVYCFNSNLSIYGDNNCDWVCLWANDNITSNKINIVYHNVWETPEEAIWWTTIEEVTIWDGGWERECNWWCKLRSFFIELIKRLK